MYELELFFITFKVYLFLWHLVTGRPGYIDIMPHSAVNHTDLRAPAAAPVTMTVDKSCGPVVLPVPLPFKTGTQ